MRRGVGILPQMRQSVVSSPISITEVNPEMWVQLGKEYQNPIVMILKIVQQLKYEVSRLRIDNERLRRGQEWIMKILSERKNHRNSIPNLDNGGMDEEPGQRNDNMPERRHTQRNQGEMDDNEEESSNIFEKRKKKSEY